MKNILKMIAATMMLISLNYASCGSASAASTSKVMWDNMELKKGQIGRVTILKETILMHIGKDPSVEGGAVRALKPGEVYRVYSTKTPDGYVPMYAVGGEYYIIQNSTLNGVHVKYETPSKAKLALLNKK
ncbi:hypothetical protein OR571_05330 [Psychrobacillus sp. NEAU-3TGS]|uniref:hypothetical protein n=1 Tax=Psychrobacillus sp. NEAU-3TGS TaxID=2995412 RepID=UPI002497C587|nr:hypothetical protein [Psychrobacillus sp. NEAU-3TGS]MDI2586569.1 hypothetical protein [Psychrobacillus sp. NEAU-3TGS]